MLGFFLIHGAAVADIATQCPIGYPTDRLLGPDYPASGHWFGSEELAVKLPDYGIWSVTKEDHLIAIKAVLTAIVVHNISCEGSTSVRTGLRVELRDEFAAHMLFLEDSAVDLVSEQLRSMEEGLDHYPEVRDLPPGGCHGTYEFLKRKPPLHQVSMDYCNNLDAGEGMLISVFIQEVHSYHFPGLGPGELASALVESLATIVMFKPANIRLAPAGYASRAGTNSRLHPRAWAARV
jgi:hypothetical protein